MTGRRANGEGTVYQRKDGRWEAAGYVMTASGGSKRVRVYAATRKQAMDQLIAKIAASRQGMPIADDGTLTVADYLTRWLRDVAVHRLRPTTFATYDRYIRVFIIPGIGRKRLAALTPKDIRTWLHQTAEICQCCAQGWDAARDPNARRRESRPRCCAVGTCCGKRVTAGTLRYLRAILSSALAHAVREDALPRNVASAVRLPDTRAAVFQPLTATEARWLLVAARPTRLGALVELALRTGLRRGELLGLGWDDLDLEYGVMDIRQTLQRAPSGGFALYPPKTQSSQRRIVLPRECITSLRAHRDRQQAEREAAREAWQPYGLVFTKPDGTPIEASTLTRHFAKLCDTAGIRRIRFHDLRHSCATLLLEQGVDLVTIKDLLGHAQIHITADVYAHVRPRLQRDAIEAMGHALRTAPDDDPPAFSASA
jgi:integrase